MKLFALMFTYPYEGNDLIGVFSSMDAAKAHAHSAQFDDEDRSYMEVHEIMLDESAKNVTYHELAEIG
jgi:hypothetical protein